jgi:hypothetical protein
VAGHSGQTVELSPPVAVEVLLLSLGNDRLCYRALRAPVGNAMQPDSVVRELFDDLSDGLIHSTSWRFESGQLLLTYVVLPDPRPSGRRSRVPTRIARGCRAAAPSPIADVAEVAAHACRHLAFLVRTDPVVAKALAAHRDIDRALSAFAPGVAGQFPMRRR